MSIFTPFACLRRPGYTAAGHAFATFASSRAAFRGSQHTYQSASEGICGRSRAGWKRAYQHSARREQYRRQAFNYQTFKGTQSVLRRWSASPYFYHQIGGVAFVCGAFYVYNLEPVPISGRYRFNVVSPEWEASMGQSEYSNVLQQYGSKILPTTSPQHHLVQRVMNRLIPASGLQNEKWEIHVIHDPQKNAFVIPGGKVFVFSGILDVTQDEEGMASVLGHEIAHNVAHHAAEAMSRNLIFLPLAAIVFALAGLDPSLGNMAVNLAFTLPKSRAQEAEADHIGLQIMAESCYDPSAAIDFWGRMEQGDREQPPQFLSTHPSHHNRLDKIREWLPKAEETRENSGCGTIPSFANEFRRTVNLQRW